MKEELLKLYSEYLLAHHEYIKTLFKNGGHTSHTFPTFEGFMQWLINNEIA